MQKYISDIIEAMKHEPNVTYRGSNNEAACHFIHDENDNVSPIIIHTMGISFPDPDYEVIRTSEQKLYVIEYILEGEGYLEIDGKKFHLKEGDAYLIEQHVAHHYYSDKKNPFKKYWINFTSRNFHKILEALEINGIYHFPNTDLGAEFNALFSLESVSLLSSQIAYNVLSIINSMLIKMAKSIKEGNNDIPEDIKRAKAILDESVKGDISIDKMCEELFMSKTTLINKFKRYYGETPKQYKIKQKIYLSSILLKETKMTIKEIASELSFSDAYSFSHCFSKVMGCSPNHYRNKDINTKL